MKKIKGEAVFLGDGAPLYRDKILSVNKKALFLGDEYWYPEAGNLIRLGFDRLRRLKKPNLDKLVPLYIKISQGVLHSLFLSINCPFF